MDAQVRRQLELEITSIERDWSRGFGSIKLDGDVTIGTSTRAAMPAAQVADDAAAEPFGRWLLAQRDRGDWIDELAMAARRDPGFPKNGDPEDVRKRMGALGIMEADVFEQIDDAERMWLSL